MNGSNTESLAQSFEFVVPDNVKKLYLIDNSINDEHLGHALESLSQIKKGGLEVIAVAKNDIGELTFHALKELFTVRTAVQNLKYLQLKKPNPQRNRHL